MFDFEAFDTLRLDCKWEVRFHRIVENERFVERFRPANVVIVAAPDLGQHVFWMPPRSGHGHGAAHGGTAADGDVTPPSTPSSATDTDRDDTGNGTPSDTTEISDEERLPNSNV